MHAVFTSSPVYTVALATLRTSELGFGNMMNKRIVPCNTLQDPEVNKSFDFLRN